MSSFVKPFVVCWQLYTEVHIDKNKIVIIGVVRYRFKKE